MIAERFGNKTDGFFIEVGALDGETFSNTYLLEKGLGWSGILVEADPRQAAHCRRNRPNSVTVAKAVTSPEQAGQTLHLNVVNGFNALSTITMTGFTRDIMNRKNAVQDAQLSVSELEVESATLDDVLTAAGAPSSIDFMSIDIEGHEEEALSGLSLGRCWRPQVLLIENSSALPDLRVSGRLARAGYGYVRTLASINDWYEPATRVGIAGGIVRQCGAAVRPSLRRGTGLLLRRIGLADVAKAALRRRGRSSSSAAS